MKVKLGIAPINWSNDDDPSLGGEISFEQCIREMSEAGYVGTELGSKYPRDVAELSGALDGQGLVLTSGWFSTFFTDPSQYDSTLSRFLDKVSFMRAMGARYINICECGYAIQGTNLPVLGVDKPVFDASQWDALFRGLHVLGRLAYDLGMELVYHYHAGTGVFTSDEIDYLMEHTSPELVSLVLDTGHAAFAGIDPVRLVSLYGARIRYVHLKDVRRDVLARVGVEGMCFMDAVRAGVFTVPGDGYLDFPSVLGALRAGGYEGWMIVEAEQDPAVAVPLVYARRAYSYLVAQGLGS